MNRLDVLAPLILAIGSMVSATILEINGYPVTDQVLITIGFGAYACWRANQE